jgi:TonB family protein
MSGSQPAIPSVLGRYQVAEELGRGAMGVVYLAVDPVIARPVAIKVIKQTELMSPAEVTQYRDRFRHEAEAAGRLGHPDLVRIYDIGPDYLVMEYVEGRPLSVALREGGAFTVRQIIALLMRMADAIDYAHRNGVVHRDIKPANIMLLDDGGVKVMDFGVARLENSKLTAVGTVVGSVRYMAPEQMLGEKVDGRADIFSLAAVAYELLTGHAPFPGKTITEVVSRVMNGGHVPACQADTRLPEPVNRAFTRAFAPKPEDRYARAMDFARELAETTKGVLDLHVIHGPQTETPTEVHAAELVPEEAGEGGAEALPEEPPTLPGVLLPAPLRDLARPATELPQTPVLSRSSRPDDTTIMTRPLPAPTSDADTTQVMESPAIPRPPRPGDATELMAPVAPAFTGDATEMIARPVPAESADATLTIRGQTTPSSATQPVAVAEPRARDAMETMAAPRALDISELPTRVMTTRIPIEPSPVTRPVAPPAPVPPLARTIIMDLASLKRDGVLMLDAEPPGAEVWLDGEPLGKAPIPAQDVAFGRHVVRLEADGREPVSVEVEVRPDRPLRSLSVSLPPLRDDVGAIRPGQFVSFGPEVAPPRRVSGSPPAYPSDAREVGLEGAPVVELWIGERGDVVDLSIVESAGAILDGALLQAVTGWRFQPARYRGVPVSVRVTVQHHFRR